MQNASLSVISVRSVFDGSLEIWNRPDDSVFLYSVYLVIKQMEAKINLTAWYIFTQNIINSMNVVSRDWKISGQDLSGESGFENRQALEGNFLADQRAA